MQDKTPKPKAKASEPVKQRTAEAAKSKAPEAKAKEFPFTRKNYILLLIGLGVTFIGFILMIGGGSDDPKVFNPAIFDFQRLTLAPILVLGGYVIEIFAIMKKPKE